MGKINHAQKQTEKRIKETQESGKRLQQLLIQEKDNQDKANTELQKQIEQLKKDLQAKAEAKKRSAVASFIAPSAQASSGIPHNGTPECANSHGKTFIYCHESSGNPAAVNSLGCRGIGQACPGTKLTCGPDFACQDAWFTNYMSRYGSWDNAERLWKSRASYYGGDWHNGWW